MKIVPVCAQNLLLHQLLQQWCFIAGTKGASSVLFAVVQVSVNKGLQASLYAIFYCLKSYIKIPQKEIKS